ncbi:MAG: ATP-dependent protease subunit HslV [Planctomycetaceae bacterium]
MTETGSRGKPVWRATTVLAVRHKGEVVLGADGQVTLGSTIMKSDTRKLRRILDGRVLVGFAGSTADAFALMERFEQKAKDFPGNIARASTELARDWRTDRALRRLEAMMIVADAELTLLLSGQGDVVQPTDGVVGIGSGGPYAASAAKALVRHSSLSAEEIVRESLLVAADIDIYTNTNIILEKLPSVQNQ